MLHVGAYFPSVNGTSDVKIYGQIDTTGILLNFNKPIC